MKDSPDPEWFNKVEKRLGAYAEEPDAFVWNEISSAIRKQREPDWAPWAHRVSVVVMLLVFIWTGKHSYVGPQIQVYRESKSENPSAKGSQDSTVGRDVEVADTKLQRDYENQTRGKSEIAQKNQSEMLRAARALKVEKIPAEEKSAKPEMAAPSAVELSATKVNEVEMLDSLQVGMRMSEPTPATDKKTIIPQRKKTGWVFYGSVSPSLSFQKFLPLKNDGVIIQDIKASSVFSANRSGFGIQAGIQSKVGRRLEFYAGFSLYHQSQTLVYRYVSEDAVHADQKENFEYAVSPATLQKSFKYAMVNAGAEAGLIYHLHGHRLAHKIGAGISWQHGIRQMQSDESYDNLQSQYTYYQVFYRNEYAVSNSVRIYVQPFFKRSIVASETLHEPFQVKPYHAGLSIGLVLHR